MKVLVRSPFWRRALRAAGLKIFHFAENNGESCSSRNGESWLLGQLIAARNAAKRPGPLIVFDVGGNVGDYTRAALHQASLTNHPINVHVFEPSPRNAEILRQAFGTQSNVQMTCAAVAERSGEAVLYQGRSGSSQASLVNRTRLGSSPPGEIKVQVIRLDEYIAAQGVSRVDLIKLDIEGAELAALRGLGEQLKPRMVEFIQFEYGGTALDARTTLKDFYDLLSEKGYVVAKLFPRALEVRPYGPWMEHYAYANYVAMSPESFKPGARLL